MTEEVPARSKGGKRTKRFGLFPAAVLLVYGLLYLHNSL